MADANAALTAALMSAYMDGPGRPRSLTKPGMQQPPDATGVIAGQYGLPPMMLNGPELREAPLTATDRLTQAILGDGRVSPETQRSVEMLTGSTGLGPSSRAPVSIMDVVGINPALRLEQDLHEGNYGKAAMDVAPYAAPLVGPIAGRAASSIGKAIAANPLEAGALIGSGAMFGGMAEAGSNDAENIKALQQELQREGLYAGKIDGINSKMTQEALRKRDERDAARRKDDLAGQTLEVEKEKAAAAKRTADVQLAEQERLRIAAEQAAADKKAGEDRLKEADKNVGFVDRAIRDYGPLVGTVLGVGTGMGTKLYVNSAYKGATQEAAERANQLIADKGRTIQSKAAALNQFWGEGQPRPWMGKTKVPYNSSPSDPGVTRNSKAPGAADLYQPRTTKNAATDIGVAGAFGAEWQAVEQGLTPGARKEVEDARTAVQADPTEANVQRLQAALNRAALTDALGNWGRGAALGYLGTGVKAQREHVRPDMAKAEKERFVLDTTLGQLRVKKGEEGAGQFAGKPKK